MSDGNQILNLVGERIRAIRKQYGISQEEFAFRCELDRTYISDIECGKRNVSLINLQVISSTLGIPLSKLFSGLPFDTPEVEPEDQFTYKVNEGFTTNRGFSVSAEQVLNAALSTAIQLEELPFALFRSIDLKALSGIVGALFAAEIANKTGSIVNPIEKGHPDVIPLAGKHASEERLRNYGEGLEIKCTVGNVAKGSKLQPGTPRLSKITGITWQAHHREVESLMGLVIDFAGNSVDGMHYPMITGVFNSDSLVVDDWGEISGTTGRNTKVTGMRASGKSKMGTGWVLLLNDARYLEKYKKTLNIPF